MIQLWEILVPTVRNDGRPIKLRFHRVWDEKIRNITGGLTVMGAVKGQWVDPEKKLFRERMIAVRVACTDEQILQVIDITLKHYDDQIAIMTYKVSNDVRITYRQ